MKEKLKDIGTVIIMVIILIGLKCSFKDEKPDDLYIKMKEISNNQSLIGLTKEQVIELLGQPKDEVDNGKRYVYYAGILTEGIFFLNETLIFDCNYEAELVIVFNEEDTVKITGIHLLP